MARSREVAEARAISVSPVLRIFISVYATAVSGELGDVDVFLLTFVRYRPLTKWMPWSVLHVNIPYGKKVIQNIKKESAIYEEKS